MRYLWVGLFIASVASLEFLHEFATADGPGGGICIAPHAQSDATRELLLQHLKSH
jgi:hypothetical protein